VRLAALILFCLVVGALLVGSVLRRLGVARSALISFVAGLLLRLGAGLVLAWTAFGAAERGGVWFGALAAALGVLAVGTLLLVGFLAWGLLKYGIDGLEGHS
jgi:hypothetical protein